MLQLENDYQIKKYGITPEQYNEMYDKQHGCCNICDRHQSEFKQRLIVEHCHTTGKVRGLVCHNCNTILGHAHDDIQILLNAIKHITI